MNLVRGITGNSTNNKEGRGVIGWMRGGGVKIGEEEEEG